MPRKVVRKNIELNEDNVNWYYEMFPGGAISGVLDQLLQNFRDCMDHTPQEYAQIAAEQLSEQLRKK